MIPILGYDITEHIYDGVKTAVYRGRRKTDQLPVVVKTLKTDFPPRKEIAKLRREYEIGRKFAHDGIVTYYDIVRSQNAYALILEDFSAMPLAELIPSHGMDLSTFLRLAIQLAQAVGEVHRKRIIHKNIKPRNIVVNPETLVAKLIDFGIASELPRETQSASIPTALEGTLGYMSPEQTGRMNRAVDYRTDFYSLGVMFYEMLTGENPFDAPSAMASVHAHIAKAPIPPQERNSETPRRCQTS